MSFDTSLFFSLYGLSHQMAWLDALFIFVGDYSTYLWLAIAAAVFVWPHGNKRKNRIAVIVAICAAVFARVVIKTLIIMIIARPRPFVTYANVQPLIPTSIAENFQSFPSGHAIFFFAFAAALFCFNKKAGTVAFVAAILMGVARVCLGVHYPSDILVGAALGTLIGWIAYLLYQSFFDAQYRKKLGARPAS